MRRYNRRRAKFAVTVRAAGSRVEGSIHLDTGDLSEGGAFLVSELLFEVGETLELEIPLPLGRTIKLSGKVVRVSGTREGETPAGMGIEFVQLAPADRRALAGALITAGIGTRKAPTS
jgi:c-di-GMP-binding flagellar brake protein YcgR